VSVFSVEAAWTGLENVKTRPTRAGEDLGLTAGRTRLDEISILARWGWRF
jgi:hypothetical protein